MAIQWNKLRSFNSSQHNAFEELVCQLANAELIDKKTKFVRIAAPDGGIESYVELENGEIYGWQAKFFLNSFSTSQWQQIGDSFKEALKNYPTLTKYYICCPVDRNNAFINGRESFLQKWETYTAKWTQEAVEVGRHVVFEYWGSFELNDRLNQEHNVGKRNYWFSEHEFSLDWFSNHNQTALANLGNRYTPEINVDLPISINLEALTRSSTFKEKFTKTCHILLSELHEYSQKLRDELSLFESLNLLIPELRQELALNKYDLLRLIPTESLKINIENTLNIINKRRDQLWDIEKRNDSESYLLNNLNKVSEAIVDLKSEICSESTQLFNGKILLLSGEAGQGKSHLLGDFIKNKEKKNGHLFFLGQEFTDKSNIWYQILTKNLKINLLEKDFLSTLDTIAEINDERFIFVIDALNEGEGRALWADNLNGFLQLISQYSRIGLVISIRDSYKQQILSKLTQDSTKLICEIKHQGFNDLEFDACKIFFDYYQIETPKIPLLNPEFSNPLYLKLFCESLKVQNLKAIPKGFNGIFNIINCYINGVNQIIADRLDVDPSLKLVNIALNLIVETQLNQKSNSLSYRELRRNVAHALSDDISDTDSKQFLDLMIRDGLLSKNILYGHEEEIVYFTYERMGDYISINYLLNKYDDFPSLLKWLKSSDNQILNVENFYYNKGLWQALSVIVPTKYNIELFDYFNFDEYHLHDFKNLIIESLVWRDPKGINPEKIRIFLNKEALSKGNWHTFIDTLYQVIAEADHPFNGLYLHKLLSKDSLSDRDSYWTKLITKDLYNCPAIERLIKWCIDAPNHSIISKPSMVNIAIGISWLFTTTKIQLRNEATFALSSLLINRLDVSLDLIDYFYNTNDPYVLERVLLAIYSSILSSNNLEHLPEIADKIDKLIFQPKEGQEIYPNVLVRDYAKNIVQYYLYKLKGSLDQSVVDAITQRITPPYNSKIPQRLPTISEIDEKYKPNDKDPNFKDYYYSANKILSSMTTEYGRGTCGYGDFGRYTFESKFHRWEKVVNVDHLSNYACELIFEKYGYDVEKHGNFDRNTGYSSRYENNVERIGKKYQWLALYEVLAKVGDNYQYPTNYWNDEGELVWLKNINDLHIREIDPIFKMHVNQTENKNEINIPKINFDDWDGDLATWVIKKDLPDIHPMIEFELNGEKWLVLERNLDFTEPEEFGVHPEKNKKNLWLQIRSYFIPKSKFRIAFDWLQEQHFMGRWMPEANEFHDLLCKEYYWTDAYNEQIFENEWKKLGRWGNNSPHNIDVMPTAERHSWESSGEENGYSFLAPCNLLAEKLTIEYSDTLGFWQDNEAKIIAFDPSATNSTYSKNILAIRKNDLLKFLDENNLKIFWTVLGEKWFRGSLHGRGKIPEHRLEFSSVIELYRKKLKGEVKNIIKDFK